MEIPALRPGRLEAERGHRPRQVVGSHPLARLARRPPGGAVVREGTNVRLEIRNAELWTGRGTGTRFLIDAGDVLSGLAGFAVVLDRRANTMPPEKLDLTPEGIAKTESRTAPEASDET